jgi:sialidase-1
LVHDKYRKDPRCQGSVIRHGDLLISTNPNSSKREKMTLYVSKDQAKSWQQVALVYPHSSAYSDLEVTDDNQVVCLYENGIKSPYERISLHVIPFTKAISAGSSKVLP